MKTPSALAERKRKSKAPLEGALAHAAVHPVAGHETPAPNSADPTNAGQEFSQVRTGQVSGRNAHGETDLEAQVQALRGGGSPLPARARAFFEPRLGLDLGQVRLHTDPEADRLSRTLGAHAFTAGSDIFFRSQAFDLESSRGRKVMAHELAHVVQQGGASVAAPATGRPSDPAEVAARRAAELAMGISGRMAGVVARSAAPASAIQCDMEDPQRFRQVHEALFTQQPGGGGALRPWQDPGQGTPGTAETLFRQAKQNIRQYMAQHPASFRGTISTRTTEAALDADALDVDRRIHVRFPMISRSASAAQIRSAVSVMTPALTSGRDYQLSWLANRLPSWCDIEQYRIRETDPRYEALLDRLRNDPDVGAALRVMSSRASAFRRGEGQARQVFVHRGVDPSWRVGLLYHELTHYYSHSGYRDWVETTANDRWYNEGFTEYLARLAMPDAVRAQRTEYQDRWDSISTEVAARVPDDDIARAYFLGEVWRIETRSPLARRQTESQLGLREAATPREEAEQSQLGPGINQTVVPGRHYRFMNLGHDRPTPKPEHVSFFRQVKAERLDPAPTLGARFIGHASTVGSAAHNERLSLRRAQAFYQMARDEGLSANRLINAANPQHYGERRVTATEEDAATRAFNRRVEMVLQPVAAGGTASQTPYGRRTSRIDVATSVQAYRTSYPDTRGGLLTQALLRRLRNRRTTPSAATAAVGAGERRFGRAPGSGEERAGVSVGRRASAAPGTVAQRRAVVIGNGIYRPGTTMGQTVEPTRPVTTSPTDARHIAGALARRGYTVNHLVNQTAAGIQAALAAALVGLAPGSELFFFYSGHGTPEGLIGVDGVAFTPSQMLSVRTAARTGLVNLIINTDACHSGIFADAIRGAELREARDAAASVGGRTGNRPLVAALDATIAVQSAKDTYNTATQAWWARRYQLEAALNAPPPITDPTTDARMVEWRNHYDRGGLHWNNFVDQANPLLEAMRTAAAAAGLTLRGLTLTRATLPFDSDGEMLVQAGLDDVDTLTNQVLTHADERLP